MAFDFKLHTMGAFWVESNGVPVVWKGKLSRDLFLLFAHRCRHHHEDVWRNQGTFVTRDEVFHHLWPHIESEKEATNVYHVTKTQLSKCLSNAVQKNGTSSTQIPDDFGFTTYKQGLYVLSEHVEVQYDVATFEQAYQTALEDQYDDINAWLLAERCYYGDFLPQRGFSAPWMKAVRQELRAKRNTVTSRIAALRAAHV